MGYNEFRDGMSVEEREKVEMEEREMMIEEREFGDLIRLKGLHHGENMNQGKTIEWMRWVGRNGGREAQWVMYVYLHLHFACCEHADIVGNVMTM